jgi:uncharacterized protein
MSNQQVFLRIPISKNPLDNSAVHPENYKFIESIAKHLKVNISDLIGNKELLRQLNYADFENEIGVFTFNDIIDELNKPGLDLRQKAKIFEFTPGIKSIDDLKIGQKINGIVTNVTDFGAFVNIGIKENGLIHKTHLSDEYVKNPTDFINIDEHITASVISLDVDRKRIGLSLKLD